MELDLRIRLQVLNQTSGQISNQNLRQQGQRAVAVRPRATDSEPIMRLDNDKQLFWCLADYRSCSMCFHVLTQKIQRSQTQKFQTEVLDIKKQEQTAKLFSSQVKRVRQRKTCQINSVFITPIARQSTAISLALSASPGEMNEKLSNSFCFSLLLFTPLFTRLIRRMINPQTRPPCVLSPEIPFHHNVISIILEDRISSGVL